MRKTIWVSKDMSIRFMDEMQTEHLINILNCIERGELSRGGPFRTATYKDLVMEAKKRHLSQTTTKAWRAK